MSYYVKELLLILKNLDTFLCSRTKKSYYTQTVLSVFLGLLLSNLGEFRLVKVLAICIGVLDGFYFCILANQLKNSSPLKKPGKNIFDVNSIHNHRTINTSGGNYTEKVGTYVQGNYIRIERILESQNLSDFTQTLQEIKSSLEQQGESIEKINSQITNELKNQIHNNSKLKEKLSAWTNELGKPGLQADESAEFLVKHAFSLSNKQLNNPITVVKGKYQDLQELLQEKKWNRADAETARLIFELADKDYDLLCPCSLLHPYYRYRDKLLAKDIPKISFKDLNTINTLWLRASDGRFGFSEQQRIWQDINNKNDITQFSDNVGWRMAGNWIYYSDLQYFSENFKGCYPAILMMSRSYLRPVVCRPNISLFKEFMRRLYR